MKNQVTKEKISRGNISIDKTDKGLISLIYKEQRR
jgi:hypothetical protein